MLPAQVSGRGVRKGDSADTLRVVTYNIHKGVQGLGPAKRLEIHNLQQAIALLDADIICLQEVRKMNRLGERRFANWPSEAQAEFLAPAGFEAVYVTNATTRHGEHGNAMLSRWPVMRHQHEDVSDHRFEQRGLLHSIIDMNGRAVHVIVVHLGLIAGSRLRQVRQLQQFIQREIPQGEPLLVAGDFNDWNRQLMPLMAEAGLVSEGGAAACLTYPARLPLAQLDHVYARGMRCTGQYVPSLTMPMRHRGIRSWSSMSDHLPLVAEFALG